MRTSDADSLSLTSRQISVEMENMEKKHEALELKAKELHIQQKKIEQACKKLKMPLAVISGIQLTKK